MIDDTIRLHFEVQRFLFEEARLLDSQDYKTWLELLTDDVHYWAPAIERRATGRTTMSLPPPRWPTSTTREPRSPCA